MRIFNLFRRHPQVSLTAVPVRAIPQETPQWVKPVTQPVRLTAASCLEQRPVPSATRYLSRLLDRAAAEQASGETFKYNRACPGEWS